MTISTPEGNAKRAAAWRNMVRQAGLSAPSGARIDVGDFYSRAALLDADEKLVNAEKLACLVLAYANSLNDILPVARAEIIGLARGICPNKMKAPGVYVDNGDGVNVHWKADE